MTETTNQQQTPTVNCYDCGSPDAPHHHIYVDDDGNHLPYSLCNRCDIAQDAADAGMTLADYLAAVPGWLDTDNKNGWLLPGWYEKMLAYYAAIAA